LVILEEQCPKIPRRGWAEMVRKIYEIVPLVCPKCGNTMKIVAFIMAYGIVHRIIHYLKLTYMAAKLPEAHPSSLMESAFVFIFMRSLLLSNSTIYTFYRGKIELLLLFFSQFTVFI